MVSYLRPLLSLLAVLTIANAAFNEANYPYNTHMDPARTYQLFWKIDTAAKKIQFAAKVQTTGWAGFGISLDGKMISSDIVIMYFDAQGTPVLVDRYASGHSLPEIDLRQDYEVINAERNGGTMIFEFSRLWDTCDNRDLPIDTSGTTRILWAYQSVAPSSATNILQHSDSGSRSLNLFSQAPFALPTLDQGNSTVLSMSNVNIPAQVTTYICRAFKFPVFSSKKHIIAAEPVIAPANKALVHHILVYDCPGLQDSDLTGMQASCYGNQLPQRVRSCNFGTPIYGWAVGGEAFYYPPNVGYPLSGPAGNDQGVQTVLMEIHYNNAAAQGGIMDSTGVRFYYAEPRQYDAGIMSFGQLQQFIVIPTGQVSFPVDGFCSARCLTQKLGGPVKIIASLLHAHTAGAAITTTVIRDGQEILLNSNEQYDFNNQQTDYIYPEFELRPTDNVKTVCKYNSAGRSLTVVGGSATTDEMCMNYVSYYPKRSLANCMSMLYLSGVAEEFTKLAVAGGMNQQTLDANLLSNKNWAARFSDAGVTWTPNQVKWWTEGVAKWNGKHQEWCDAFGGSEIIMPTITEPYVKPPVCTAAASSLTPLVPLLLIISSILAVLMM